jgi:aldose 1-epimerase
LSQSGIHKDVFGTLADGSVVESITLTNTQGMSVCIITYGASIQSVSVPDVNGSFADVTTGYATLEEYVARRQFFGSTVGRVANRIAKSRFTLNGIEYRLPSNDRSNSHHGGEQGFDRMNWDIVEVAEDNLAVTLQLISPDGDQGYPGTLTVTATYSLYTDNSLAVEYKATTDAPTVVNLSNHAHWNLSGEGSRHDTMDHILTIHADHFLPVDAELIPTGEYRSVESSAFDFRSPLRISTHIRDEGDPQIGFGRGYDHNWVIADSVSDSPRVMAYLEDPRTGRTMTLLSNQPGLQFYSGNFFDGSTTGKAGKLYRMGDAIALEPQQFPDSPNQPSFPSIALNPGQTYSNSIIWRFGTSNAEE